MSRKILQDCNNARGRNTSDREPESDQDALSALAAALNLEVMHIDPIETPATPVATRTTRRTKRRVTVAAASVLSVGLLAGSIYVQDAATPVASASTAAASVSDIAGISENVQLTSFLTPNRERTHEYAETTIATANDVIASTQDKVDATPLASSVASLGNYRSLDSVTVATLAKATQTETQKVQAAAAEVDRVAAEVAAAAAAEQAAQQAAAAAAEQSAAAAAKTAAAAAQAAANAASTAGKTPAAARAIARDMAASSYGWGESQFSCLSQLWERESNWSYTAYNASGGATGIPQALPGSKMASAGSDWATNPTTQITWGLQYIKSSYGTPCAAWAHSEAVNWY